MAKFEKGDKFIPRKPKEDYSELEWVSNMDKYEGKELVVEHIFELKNMQCPVVDDWVFHPDWCEKVSSSEIPNNHTMKAGIFDEHIRGELDLLENKKLITEQPSSPQPISTKIDWEQRRYELTKEFVAAKIFWIGYEKITNQVITRTIEIADEVIKQLKSK